MPHVVGALTIMGPLFVGWPVGAVLYLLFYSLLLACCVYSSGAAWLGVLVWLVYLRGIVVIFLFFASVLPAPIHRTPSATPILYALVAAGVVGCTIAAPAGQTQGFVLVPLVTGGRLVLWLGGVLLIAILICSGGNHFTSLV